MIFFRKSSKNDILFFVILRLVNYRPGKIPSKLLKYTSKSKYISSRKTYIFDHNSDFCYFSRETDFSKNSKYDDQFLLENLYHAHRHDTDQKDRPNSLNHSLTLYFRGIVLIILRVLPLPKTPGNHEWL